jgi:very-short-patch-repair endonuclease
VGEAFVSPHAPKVASAVEAELRQRLAARFDLDLRPNAVRVARPFFNQLEVWPDIVIPELRVAIEYDSVGRHGLEHVGRHEEKDRKKDRLLRAVGWEVVRIRAGKLLPLGPHDLVAGSVSDRLVERIDDGLAAIRGDLIVASYRRAERL